MAPYFALFVAAAVAIVCTSAQETYMREALKRHNSYRAKHGSPALKLDDALFSVPSITLEKEKSTTVVPKPKVSVSSKGAPALSYAAKSAVDAWYNEIKGYNYNAPKRSRGVTGHFTQVVWKDSKKVGIGAYQDKKSKSTYVAALYTPAGNFNGDYNYRRNVRPPTSG